MRVAVHHAFRYLRPLHERVGVQLAKLEARLEQPLYAHVDLFFGYLASLHGIGQPLVVAAALHVGAAEHCLCRRAGGIVRHSVAARAPEVAYGSAVADHQSVESPLVAEYLLQQSVAPAARLSLKSLVGAHHLLHPGFLHKVLESGQVGLPEVACGEVVDVKLVPCFLRAAVHCEVFGAGKQLAVLVAGGALQAAYHGLAHARVHVWILAVRLLAPAPARVAEYVDCRRPERKALVLAYFAFLLLRGVFCAGLVAYRRVDAFEQGIVKGGRHADARREGC